MIVAASRACFRVLSTSHGGDRIDSRDIVTSVPNLAWTFDAEDAVASSAAIVGGTVYVASKDGLLHAIDLATGK
jgi:outer membrane protein assembly factor BamB